MGSQKTRWNTRTLRNCMGVFTLDILMCIKLILNDLIRIKFAFPSDKKLFRIKLVYSDNAKLLSYKCTQS